jgi:hypothetical protein
VLIALDRLLVRVRQVPSRAGELIALRERLRDQRRAEPDAEERAAAAEVRRLKRVLADASGAVDECSRCGTGMPLPGGAFAGGFCCQAATADLFSDDEVALLAQGGTRLADLTAPRSRHAGCSFRGETGCTLETEDRPAVCVRFACTELRRELHRRGRLDEIERIEAELDAAYGHFSRLRAARVDREEFEALIQG